MFSAHAQATVAQRRQFLMNDVIISSKTEWSRMEASSSDLPSVIACIPELVYEVLSILPARVLYTCTQVNRLWYHVARSVLRKRVSCSAVFVHERNIEHSNAKEYCESLYSTPRVVFLFSYEDIWLNRRDKPRRRGLERQLVKSIRHLYDELPEDCQVLGCTTEKLIYHLPENFPSGPVHKKRGHVAISFPEVSGVKYHTVHVRHLRYHSRDWSRLFRFAVNHPVKLAIILALPQSRDMIAHIASGMTTISLFLTLLFSSQGDVNLCSTLF